LIHRSDPIVAAAIQEQVKYFVPIKTADLRTHNSFTAKNLSEVIFVSDAYNDMKLAEAIVHEFYHIELNLLMEVEDLFIPDPHVEPTYYSPWRDDPRPLFGLLHAIYVFSGVLEFLDKVQDKSSLFGLDQSQLTFNRIKIYWQLRVGFKSLPFERLTATGLHLFQSIQNDLYQRYNHFASTKLPAVIGEHMTRWENQNGVIAAAQNLQQIPQA
jgi:HEXXH motif-containing protein